MNVIFAAQKQVKLEFFYVYYLLLMCKDNKIVRFSYDYVLFKWKSFPVTVVVLQL